MIDSGKTILSVLGIFAFVFCLVMFIAAPGKDAESSTTRERFRPAERIVYSTEDGEYTLTLWEFEWRGEVCITKGFTRSPILCRKVNQDRCPHCGDVGGHATDCIHGDFIGVKTESESSDG